MGETREIPASSLAKGHLVVTVSGSRKVDYVDWARTRPYVIFVDGKSMPVEREDTVPIENDWRAHRTAGYHALMNEIRMHDFDDPHGTGVDWYFATAGVVWMETGEQVNEYNPSILYSQGDWEADFTPDGTNVDMLRDMLEDGTTTVRDIKRVNDIMTRYLTWVKLAGRDY